MAKKPLYKKLHEKSIADNAPVHVVLGDLRVAKTAEQKGLGTLTQKDDEWYFEAVEVTQTRERALVAKRKRKRSSDHLLKPIAERIAMAADQHGLTEAATLKHADIVREYALELAQPADVELAQHINAKRIRAVVDAITPKTPPVREAASEEPSAPPEKKAKSKEPKENKEPKKENGHPSYEGHSATSVIRAMGKAGWDFPTTCRAARSFAPNLADGTLKIQWNRGKKGIGAPAPLSKAQLAVLKKKCLSVD